MAALMVVVRPCSYTTVNDKSNVEAYYTHHLALYEGSNSAIDLVGSALSIFLKVAIRRVVFGGDLVDGEKLGSGTRCVGYDFVEEGLRFDVAEDLQCVESVVGCLLLLVLAFDLFDELGDCYTHDDFEKCVVYGL
jgi:hypothetical protein